MATAPTTQFFTNIPQPREIITDLRATPPRPDATRDPFFFTIFGSPELENIPFGGGITFTGQSQRASARDRVFSDRLLAILQRDLPALERASVTLAETRVEDIPSDKTLAQQKRVVIQAAAPVALGQEIVELETEQEKIERSRALTPIIIEFKTAQTQRTRAEAEKRAAEAAQIIDLTSVIAERESSEAEFLRAKAAQTALEARVFDLATGGLDFFSKQVFARELTRVAAGERPFFAPVERRRRVITSF